MALTLVTTAKSDSANSYLTEAEADAYFEAMPFNTVWSALTQQQKYALLIVATRSIDRAFVYAGDKTATTQALQFPRYDEDTIPQEVKDAQAEMIVHLHYDRDATTGQTSNAQEIAEVEVYQNVKTKFRDHEHRETNASVAGGSIEAVRDLLREHLSSDDDSSGSATFDWE